MFKTGVIGARTEIWGIFDNSEKMINFTLNAAIIKL